MKKNFFSHKGLTILEVMISITIFSLLAGVIFYTLSVSTSVWVKISNTVELEGKGELVLGRIEKELRASTIKSVKIIKYPEGSDNDAISFLSCYDKDMKAGHNSLGKVKWKSFVLFYIEDDPKINSQRYYQLRSRKVLLGEYSEYFVGENKNTIDTLPFPPVIANSNTFEMIDYITDNLPATSPPDLYITEPRSIARNIRSLNFLYEEDTRKIDMIVTFGKPQNGSYSMKGSKTEEFDLKTTIILKNSN